MLKKEWRFVIWHVNACEITEVTNALKFPGELSVMFYGNILLVCPKNLQEVYQSILFISRGFVSHTCDTFFFCARFGPICIIEKTLKTPIGECYFKYHSSMGVFHVFFNCTNGIKSWNTSHMNCFDMSYEDSVDYILYLI